MRMVIVLILLCLSVVSNADVLPAETRAGAEQQTGKEATAVAEEAPPDTIQSHGDTYISACTTSELKRIKADVLRFAGTRNPDNAWQVVNTMLCREDESAKRFILKHMPKTIAIVDSSYGEIDSKRIEASPDLLLRKNAWRATIEGVDAAHIEVSYYSNEACMGSFPVLFNGHAWLITKIETNCD